MDEKNNTDGDLRMTNEEQDTSKTRKEESTSIRTVPFHKLFSFADSTDYSLMLVGTISAVGNGLCLPLMTVIFGTMVDSFGESGNTKQVLPKISKVFALMTSHLFNPLVLFFSFNP